MNPLSPPMPSESSTEVLAPERHDAVDRERHKKLRLLIREGMESAEVSADAAFERLRRVADELATL